MYAYAKRTDSRLGIVTGKVYDIKVYKGSYGEKVMVHTDGYTVAFNEDDFEFLTPNENNETV